MLRSSLGKKKKKKKGGRRTIRIKLTGGSNEDLEVVDAGLSEEVG